ncbi:3-deoxy-manno-octulosonate cytidylyltransferase [Prolixibacteraceae bacterium JC049]|nr:3-deoxy-manno-octulosonate cytidylyltransferase [Prolixibacteraceae bacterium JC049]
MKFLGVIPARYASTRFPGKPLVDIKGKPMIQRVYEQAQKALEHVVVATDDQRIFDAVTQFGGNVVMTSEDHQSGTDRCAEAVEKFQQEANQVFDVVINIQGDEPFIQPDQIESLKECFTNDAVDIATLVRPTRDKSLIFDPNKVKVVTGVDNRAIYFSRSPIPFVRGVNEEEWGAENEFLIHLGMYGYRTAILEQITTLVIGKLEKNESLEQLRWLENGLLIMTGKTEHESYGIDTPEDLKYLMGQQHILELL